jgi:hypothetical protein
VCSENLDSPIVVVKAAKDRMRHDGSGPLNRARDWRILVQRSMRSHFVARQFRKACGWASLAVPSESSRYGTGVILVLIATLAWSTGGLFTRLLPFDSWTIVFWRGVFGTLFIGCYVAWRYGRHTLKVIRAMGPIGAFITGCSAATICRNDHCCRTQRRLKAWPDSAGPQ